jgi:hypothetical protein
MKGGKKKLSVLNTITRKVQREANPSEEFNNHAAESMSFATAEEAGNLFNFTGSNDITNYFGKRKASPLKPTKNAECDPIRELR